MSARLGPRSPLRAEERRAGAGDRRRTPFRWRCPACGSPGHGHLERMAGGGVVMRCRNPKARKLHPNPARPYCGVIDSRAGGGVFVYGRRKEEATAPGTWAFTRRLLLSRGTAEAVGVAVGAAALAYLLLTWWLT